MVAEVDAGVGGGVVAAMMPLLVASRRAMRRIGDHVGVPFGRVWGLRMGLAGEPGLAVVADAGVGGEGGGGDDAAAGGQQEGDAADFGDMSGFLSVDVGPRVGRGISARRRVVTSMVPRVGGGVCRLDDTKRVNVPTFRGGYRPSGVAELVRRTSMSELAAS